MKARAGYIRVVALPGILKTRQGCRRNQLSDRIYLDELSVPCRIGVSPQERRRAQRVIVRVSLYLDLSTAAQSDSLADSIDYRKVKARVAEVASAEEYTLLEGLADAIADALLADFGTERVVVNVRKAKYSTVPAIGVEIERKGTPVG